jgi:hypothetical protein
MCEGQKLFDPESSPYHLTFTDGDGQVCMKEFVDLIELAHFVGYLGLKWGEYAIVHGELLKSIPDAKYEDFEQESFTTNDTFHPPVTILPPDQIKDLLEQ